MCEVVKRGTAWRLVRPMLLLADARCVHASRPASASLVSTDEDEDQGHDQGARRGRLRILFAIKCILCNLPLAGLWRYRCVPVLLYTKSWFCSRKHGAGTACRTFFR